MRKITLLLFICALFVSSFAQVNTKSGNENSVVSATKNYPTTNTKADPIYFEGFESGIDSWTNLDVDGDGFMWQLFENSLYSHSGDFSMISASWEQAALTPENWFISPAIDLTGETGSVFVDYYVRPIDPDWQSEHYKLVVSTTGVAVEDFTTIAFEETIELGDENGYSVKTVDLSDFAGETIHLAWVHYNCSDWYYIALDDISVYVPEAKLLDFYAEGGVGEADIDNEAFTVAYTVIDTTDLTDLQTTFVASPGAQVTETTNDYTNPVEVLVESADEEILNTYTVTVNTIELNETSIKDIQFTEDESGDSPMVGKLVKVQGTVTAALNNGLFIADAAGEWNGILAYTGGNTGLSIGDSVDLTGFVKEYYNLTEIEVVDGSYLGAAEEIEPTAIDLADMVEPYEGVLVELGLVTVAEEVNSYGEWKVTDGNDTIVLDDKLLKYEPSVGDMFTSITGVVDYSFGAYKLLPRDSSDVIPFDPTVVTIKDIQFTEDESGDSPLLGEAVTVHGIVTAALYNGIFIADAAGEWNGIWAYVGEDTELVPGDSVYVSGFVKEWYDFTEIDVVDGDFLGTATVIEPTTIDLAEMVEPLEGVLVKTGMVTVAEAVNDYGEWKVTDGNDTIVLDDKMLKYEPAVGDKFESITGVVDYSFGAYKLLPRDSADIVIYNTIETTNALQSISMYPNPVNNELNFTSLEGVSEIVISNVLGQAMIVKKATSNTTINTSDLVSGIYIVTLVSENGKTYSERIIKE